MHLSMSFSVNLVVRKKGIILAFHKNKKIIKIKQNGNQK
jgi:hypothetical protein